MNGVHDMGGMHGFGTVHRDPTERGFHAEWEAHVVVMNALLRGRGLYNIDEFRFGIEQMEPARYLQSSYFERWLATVEFNLTRKGVLSAEEIDARMQLLQELPGAVLPRPPDGAPIPPTAPEPVESTASMPEPHFAVGDEVVSRNTHPGGHTRLPRYARGKRGVIYSIHGSAIFPDTHAHGRGENPQVLYSVRFDGQELWGDSAEASQSLYLDLWESYLTLASS